MRPTRLLPLLLALSACESDPVAVVAATVEVSAAVDPVNPRIVEFELENRGGRTAYIGACDDRVVPRVQRKGEYDDDNVAVLCLAIYSAAPVALQPGEPITGTAPVPGPGEYRVAFAVYADRDGTERHRVAASSEVVVPR
jgi:hypothetical protein